MVQQRVKRIEKLVKLLKDPQPRWVALVDHGANQTPFQTLKRVGKVTPVKRGKRAQSNAKGERTMARRRGKRLSRKAASKPTALRKIVFDSDEFSSEDDVKKWLKENDYEGDMVITSKESDEGDVFEVAEKGVEDSDFESTREVSTDTPGVTGVVGALSEAVKSDEDEDEGEEESSTKSGGIRKRAPKGKAKKSTKTPSKKTKSVKSVIAQKFDPWAAWISEGRTVEEIIKDGMRDGTPPGFDDIVFATTQAMANLLKNEDGEDLQTKLSSVGEEMSSLIFKVHSVFAELSDDDDEESTEKSWDDTIKKTLLIFEESFITEDDEDEDEDKSVQKSATDEDSGKVLTALKDLGKVIKSLSKNIEDLTEEVAEAKDTAEAAAELAEKAQKGVDKFSKKAPTKKSAPTDGPDDEEEDGEELRKADDAFDKKMVRNLFGA